MPAVPEVLRISDEFRTRLAAQEAGAVRDMARSYAQVTQSLTRAANDLTAKVAALRASGEVVPGWRIAQLDRYRDLLAQAQEELARLGLEDAQRIANLQREGLTQGLAMAEAQVQALIPPGVSIAFNKFPTGALESMVGFLQDGSPLARLLSELGVASAQRIGEILQNGLALGQNPRVVARLLRRQVGLTLTRSMRIARSEMLRAWRRSSIQGYRDQGGLIKGYRRKAHNGRRTCIACLLADGEFYEVESDFSDHVLGRCSVIPVTRSWEELGFSGIPDTNPTWESGRTWFLGQPEDAQRSILGDPIFDAWRGGQIGLEDMTTVHSTPEWGDEKLAASLKAALSSAEQRGLGAVPVIGGS